MLINRLKGLSYGLRSRMLIFFGFGIAAILVVFRLISYYGIPALGVEGEERIFRNAVIQGMTAVADEKKYYVEQWMMNKLKDVREIARSSAVKELVFKALESQPGSDNVRRLSELMKLTAGGYGSQATMELVDAATGRISASTSDSNASVQADYWKSIQEMRESGQSEKIFFRKSETEFGSELLIISTVRKHGKAHAYFVLRQGSADLLDNLLRLPESFGRSGEVVLIDMNRLLLMPLKNSLSDGSRAVPLEYVLSSDSASYASWGIETVLEAKDYRGIRAISAVRHVRVLPEFGMGIIVKRDYDEVFEPVLKIQRLLIAAGLLSIIVLIIAVYLISMRIAAPIEVMSRAARRIEEGDLAARCAVNSSGEIATLVNAFNDMAEQIQHSHALLEQEVRERTRELEVSNAELTLEIDERRLAEAEKAKLQDQLLQAQKMESVGRLAGGVAHDFNNMIAVIFMAVDLIRMHVTDDPKLLHLVDDIDRAATRSRDITRQLLAFSRKQIIQPRPLDLNRLVAESEKSIARLIGEDISLCFRPKDGLCSVKVDPSQIDQILINLAVNARDAMPDGGILTIETDELFCNETVCDIHADCKQGRYVVLTVSDNGTGIDKELLSHIFEPFFTTKEVGKGTGLGLSTIYGIVKQNSGFVNVYSEKGHGTTFKIYLPCYEGESEEGAKRHAAEHPRGSERILIAEDEAQFRKVTAKILGVLGYDVVEAESPKAAIALVEAGDRSFDLLLTDVIMPGINGRMLREQIETYIPDIKVLFMSGYPADIIASKGILEEGVEFIQKPFSTETLALRLREIFSSGRQH